ncbi:penicillin-binding protein 1C [Tenacibaculum sp. SG-28]|uniref:penicillin-binding protein 1C n=1 Tax=Tenacibaculum sp. SG-28 TaxID=754426 RepID=UPI000CF47C1A|nr:penicillin-binding protein 1C [Tenacibaculum sp. SG-28]PQJ23432.1 penicillin-binding protein 1C [Tenacibaculum sp. SG-28]
MPIKRDIQVLKQYQWLLIGTFLISICYYYSLPKSLFNDPTATVIKASNGELLGATIAEDGQWRFPELDTVPEKFKQCILQFEDAYFYKHPGFNPVSMVKAIRENSKAKRIVRGGSTITQQVIRLSRKNQKRTYLEKCKELWLATRLELAFSKEEILKLYASHAPFGGNVVGLEMAAWRYFGLAPSQLSWAESATLAVLPNAPSLIYPGKNKDKLLSKRDGLLRKLWKQGIIDTTSYALALEEELPQKPYPLPTIANHFVQEVAQQYRGKRIRSSIVQDYQKQINELVARHHNMQQQNEVHNMAVLVLDVATRKVISYVGNSPTTKTHQKDVNNIIAARSTGSTLKPFLFAHMLQSGAILPSQLIPDIPTQIAGYSPKNFALTYDGAVPANEALTRSLNIPAVRMLQSYGLEKFRANLTGYQIEHLNKPASHYGLSLVLGGAEASLWDLCKTYAGYAGTINHFEELQHRYYTNEFVTPSFLDAELPNFGPIVPNAPLLNAGAVYLTLQTLTEVNRPVLEQAWKYYDSSQKIAWKTGTSFGNKDAWAIGVTPKYVVGVWIGNSDGEGRPELTGVGSAGPLLFDVFDVLPKSQWFVPPHEDLLEVQVCKESGYLALPICEAISVKVPNNGERASSCPYHQLVSLDSNEQYRVHSNCTVSSEIKTKPWFVLPPVIGYYYQQRNAAYTPLPAFREDCVSLENKTMDFVYPTSYRSTLSVTKGIQGNSNAIILKVAHAYKEAEVYWYVNNEYRGITSQFHEKSFQEAPGEYKITVLDTFGNTKTCWITLQ